MMFVIPLIVCTRGRFVGLLAHNSKGHVKYLSLNNQLDQHMSI